MSKTIEVKFFDSNGRAYTMDVAPEVPAIPVPWSGSEFRGAPCVSENNAWDDPKPISALIERGETEFYVSDLEKPEQTFWFGRLPE